MTPPIGVDPADYARYQWALGMAISVLREVINLDDEEEGELLWVSDEGESIIDILNELEDRIERRV